MKISSSNILNVLFVDDDTDESYLFNEALEQSGLPIQLLRAQDGVGLLQTLQKPPLPDVILMDINMPYKDGIEALVDIRSRNEFDKIVVVIYSISSSKESIKVAYDKGADLYLIKPDDFEGMLAVVKKIYSINWGNFTRPSQKDFVLNLNR